MKMQVVLVTVTGPDPQGVKLKQTPNSTSRDGMTTLSSTGIDVKIDTALFLIGGTSLPTMIIVPSFISKPIYSMQGSFSTSYQG